VPDSTWSSQNFTLSAGMVIIQPSTHKIVVVYDTATKTWFFPRGRKDMNESLERTALREAFEESGYHAEFLPLLTPTRAPPPSDDPGAASRPNVEPIFFSTSHLRPRPGKPGWEHGFDREYLTAWYVGQIPENAVHYRGTGMADEQSYVSRLCTYRDAMEKVWGKDREVLRYAWALYTSTLEAGQLVSRA